MNTVLVLWQSSNKMVLKCILILGLSCGLAMSNETIELQTGAVTLLTGSHAEVARAMDYIESGVYEADIQRQVAHAYAVLSQNLVKDKKQPYAITFDIDETLIGHYSAMKKHGFKLMTSDEFIGSDASRIESVYALYKFAQRHNIAVFIITGRPVSYQDFTAKQLQALDIDGWTELVLNNAEPGLSTQAYKARVRQRIRDDGYNILINIGDQDSDLVVSEPTVSIKLPNPFYEVS